MRSERFEISIPGDLKRALERRATADVCPLARVTRAALESYLGTDCIWRDGPGAPEGDYRSGEPDHPVNLHLGPKHWEQWGDFEQEWIRVGEPTRRVFGPLPVEGDECKP